MEKITLAQTIGGFGFMAAVWAAGIYRARTCDKK